MENGKMSKNSFKKFVLKEQLVNVTFANLCELRNWSRFRKDLFYTVWMRTCDF